MRLMVSAAAGRMTLPRRARAASTPSDTAPMPPAVRAQEPSAAGRISEVVEAASTAVLAGGAPRRRAAELGLCAAGRRLAAGGAKDGASRQRHVSGVSGVAPRLAIALLRNQPSAVDRHPGIARRRGVAARRWLPSSREQILCDAFKTLVSRRLDQPAEPGLGGGWPCRRASIGHSAPPMLL